jgi:hypothetical protein
MVRGDKLNDKFPSRGLSLELNVNLDQISTRGAFKITSLPTELIIKQRGIRVDHFEVIPVDDMLEADYIRLLSNIKTEQAF